MLARTDKKSVSYLNYSLNNSSQAVKFSQSKQMSVEFTKSRQFSKVPSWFAERSNKSRMILSRGLDCIPIWCFFSYGPGYVQNSSRKIPTEITKSPRVPRLVIKNRHWPHIGGHRRSKHRHTRAMFNSGRFFLKIVTLIKNAVIYRHMDAFKNNPNTWLIFVCG